MFMLHTTFESISLVVSVEFLPTILKFGNAAAMVTNHLRAPYGVYFTKNHQWESDVSITHAKTGHATSRKERDYKSFRS